MAEFKLPEITGRETLEELREKMGMMVKELKWLFDHWDDANILDLHGVKIIDGTVNGDNKLANDTVTGSDKLVDLSVIWAKIGNTRVTGEFNFNLEPGTETIIPIQHPGQLLYKFAGPPMVRPKGSTTSYGHDVRIVSFAYWDDKILAECAYYEEGTFAYYIKNIDTIARTGTIEWYRDGIYQ